MKRKPIAATTSVFLALFLSGCTAELNKIYEEQVVPYANKAYEGAKQAYEDRKPTPKTGEWPHSEFGGE